MTTTIAILLPGTTGSTLGDSSGDAIWPMRALITLLSIATFACASTQQTQQTQQWLQQPCTVQSGSAWLPTIENQFILDGVRVGDGPRHALQIDTGSTGIAIGYMRVQNSTPLTAAEIARLQIAPNYISYNSSGHVPVGRWVWASVRLQTGIVIPKAPVLAVERMCRAQPNALAPYAACAQLPPVQGPCTPENIAGSAELRDVCRIGMMGVGFDRSMGTWLVNPFLNAQPMIDGTMQRGYIVRSDGVQLGMSETDLADFRFMPLSLIQAPYEWAQATGCVTVSGGGIANPGTPICGNTLVDTGLNEMFVSYAAASMPSFDPPLPPSGDLWNCLFPRPQCGTGAPNASVKVSWPDAAGSLFTYDVSTPQQFSATGRTPSRLHVRNAGVLPNANAPVFVNTGRQLLQTGDYLYDATCGRIGFRRLED